MSHQCHNNVFFNRAKVYIKYATLKNKNICEVPLYKFVKNCKLCDEFNMLACNTIINKSLACSYLIQETKVIFYITQNNKH